MQVMDKLAVEIGYRIVGTKEHLEAEDWLEGILRKYEGMKKKEGIQGDHDVQVEVWKQVEDGAHRSVSPRINVARLPRSKEWISGKG